MKILGCVAIIIVVFVGGFLAGGRFATQRMQGELAKAKGDTEIFRAETEKLSMILRDIRQAAAQATVVEKAQ